MVKKFALIFGIVYALVGVMGFIPALVTQPEMNMASHMDHGLLLGLFPVNLWHNLYHVAIGLWGVFAANQFNASVTFARVNAVLFAALAIFGLFPGLNTLFGFLPLYGHDVWLHAATAALTAYFGFGAPSRLELA